MLFLTMVNTVLAKMRQDPITDLSTDPTTFAFRAQEAVNRAIARVWNHKSWAFRRQKAIQNLSSGASEYELPFQGEVYSVTSNAAPYKLTLIPEHLFNLYVPNPSNTGNPYVGVLTDWVGVRNDPAAASVITAVSTSASDTTQILTIFGSANGVSDYESITLSGTTPVSTTKLFASIVTITINAVVAGKVAVTADSGVTELKNFGPGATQPARFQHVVYYPAPASTITVTFRFLGLPPYLFHKYQDCLTPSRWAYVVDQWAFALMLQSQGQDQLAEATSQMQLAMKMLEEDMFSEETISVEDHLMSLKVGDGGDADQGFMPPAGTNWVS